MVSQTTEGVLGECLRNASRSLSPLSTRIGTGNTRNGIDKSSYRTATDLPLRASSNFSFTSWSCIAIADRATDEAPLILWLL